MLAKTSTFFVMLLAVSLLSAQELASTKEQPSDNTYKNDSTFVIYGIEYTHLSYPDENCYYKGKVETSKPVKHLSHFNKVYRGFSRTKNFEVYTNLLCYTNYSNLQKDRFYAIRRSGDGLIMGFARYDEKKKKYIVSDPFALPIGNVHLSDNGKKYSVYDDYGYLTSSNKENGANALPWAITAGAILLVLGITGAVN